MTGPGSRDESGFSTPTARLGLATLHYTGLSAVALAGFAALRAPPPWSWIGCSASVVAIWSIVWLARRHRLRSAADRRRIESLEVDSKALQIRSELQAELLASLPIGVVAVRSDRPVYANAAAAKFLGERITEAGAPIPTPVRQVIEEATRGGSATKRLSQGLPRRIMEVCGHPSQRDDVIVLHLLDITQRVQADRTRQDFVVAASHELKTPVAAIKAAAETILVAMDEDPEAVFDFSGRIFDNALRMSRIVTDLLDLSRLESDSPHVEPFDLADVLEEEIERFSSSLPGIDFAAAPTPMIGSPSDLALAFRNLLENAVRNTPEQGRVAASVVSDNGEATIVVSDTGSGIPASDLPRIFERFYRVDAARSRSTGGTGLGLAIVKHVAELHGGRVEVESRLGQGSTFRIRVPSVPADRAF
ncbi:MAG: ATP-binding protein [bacterium]|nr:ATP-binding protein [bacterium]MDE0288334.1 ATP-binding protein [bacterium]MDE0437869.1 ATP-binding protein [bacterium]